ncbi:MAG: type II secretion system protein [Elusimicrobiaceae bacterium]|nr:type II secretion system protein [Elusimicrobiaceae bacterium]
MNNKAFTLIELLVVVLIIGVLSAIALPQYEKSVTKTRIMTGMPIGRALATALDEYNMANPEGYTAVYDNLVLGVPPNFTDKDGNAYSNVTAGSELYYDVGKAGQKMFKILSGGKVQYTYLLPNGKKINIYFYAQNATADSGDYKGRIYCTGESNAAAATEYCKAIGGVKDGSKYFLN